MGLFIDLSGSGIALQAQPLTTPFHFVHPVCGGEAGKGILLGDPLPPSWGAGNESDQCSDSWGPVTKSSPGCNASKGKLLWMQLWTSVSYLARFGLFSRRAPEEDLTVP